MSSSRSVPLGGDGHTPQVRALEGEESIDKAMLDAAQLAILLVNASGQVLRANSAAYRMYGLAPRELHDTSFPKFLPKRSDKSMCKAWLKAPTAGREEWIFSRNDGSRFPAEVNLSSVETPEGTFGVFSVLDVSKQKSTEAALLHYQKRLQQLNGALLSAQEDANRSLARELHDVLSQELSGIGILASIYADSAPDDRDLHDVLAEISTRVGSVADDLHRTSRRLHPAILDDMGLVAAIRSVASALEGRSATHIKIRSRNIPSNIPRDISLCLYRIVQESLRNIEAHANAEEVGIFLKGISTGISMEIRDYGDGFDLEHSKKAGGLGLVSMEERARLVGGTLQVHSHPGDGTSVIVSMPLRAKYGVYARKK